MHTIDDNDNEANRRRTVRRTKSSIIETKFAICHGFIREENLNLLRYEEEARAYPVRGLPFRFAFSTWLLFKVSNFECASYYNF